MGVLSRLEYLEREIAKLKKRATVAGGGFPVSAHASRHSDGGSDPIDLTDLDGFPGGTSLFLRADGTFAVPPGSDRSRVRAATTANITIATALNNGDSLDGVTLATGDLVLVKNQSTAAENGIYVVGASPARASEFDTYDEHPGSLIAVQEGTTNADTLWLCTSNVGGTLNTTAIAFTEVDFSGGGGSGDSTTTNVHASRPAAGNDGNVFFPSDGLAIDRDNGSTWQPWGPIFPLTAPVDGDFAWINQGSATVTAAKGSIFLDSVDATGGGATYELNIRKKAAPSTPYTVTAAFTTHMHAAPTLSVGLAWRQSSDGKLITFEYDFTGQFIYGGAKWNSPTSHNSNYWTANVGGRLALIWMRLTDDGTNRIMSISADGVNWRVMHTVGRTDFMTADEVGFYVHALGASNPCSMTLISWKEA